MSNSENSDQPAVMSLVGGATSRTPGQTIPQAPDDVVAETKAAKPKAPAAPRKVKAAMGEEATPTKRLLPNVRGLRADAKLANDVGAETETTAKDGTRGGKIPGHPGRRPTLPALAKGELPARGQGRLHEGGRRLSLVHARPLPRDERRGLLPGVRNARRHAHPAQALRLRLEGVS